MRYVTLCDWLLSLGIRFSRFIHVVDVSVFHCFFIAAQYYIVWLYHICLAVYQLMDI